MLFPWVLVFDLAISTGCHTILQNFQGWKLVFSRISKCRRTHLKFQLPLVWIFSGIIQFHGIVYVFLYDKVFLCNTTLYVKNCAFCIEKLFFVILLCPSKNVIPILTYWWNSLQLRLSSNLRVIFCNDKSRTLQVGYYLLGWVLYSRSAG